LKKYKSFLLTVSLIPSAIVAQVLSSNGYSGVGMVPSTSTVLTGNAVFGFDKTIPGGTNTKGFNTQIGLGLYSDIELVGRLATNDLKCNMFIKDACPKGNIRDFSASLKWSLPLDWLKRNQSQIALGATDMGGAASYFKSYYAVASKEVGPVNLTLGRAKAVADYAPLKGIFGSISYSPASWIDLNIQKIGSNSWAIATLKSELPISQVSSYITLNQRISDEKVTEKQWVGVGVTFSLDRATNHRKVIRQEPSIDLQKNKVIKNLNPTNLKEILEKNGFLNPIIKDYSKLLEIQIENTAYAWNTIDAVGVALGAIADSYGNSIEKTFELNITTRGITQVIVNGDTMCLKRWLESGEVCGNLSIRSGLQRHTSINLHDEYIDNFFSNFNNWLFRPELVLSPTFLSSIGTEFGAFDMDGGVNINVVLPLWRGATIETNQIKPLGIGTRGFEQGGVFYASRLKPATSRSLFHQLINVPSINTQARLSVGTAYTAWDGHQIETTTQSDAGQHRLGLTAGSFKNDSLSSNRQKTYELATYRYAHDDRMSTVTELTTGKYWGGDRGWSIGQKFWHGDTSLSIYVRRTRLSESSPLVSFAGLQLSIPITPRVNKGLEHFALRGTNQWTYTLESRVFERENLLTGGYGEVPRIGDSLIQTFNRDRNSTHYLESSLIRAKSAFNELSAE
jgi:hypothetical protein